VSYTPHNAKTNPLWLVFNTNTTISA